MPVRERASMDIFCYDKLQDSPATLSTLKAVNNADYLAHTSDIPSKPLHNSDTVSVHFNHFYCMGICDKLSRHLSMLTLNMDEC